MPFSVRIAASGLLTDVFFHAEPRDHDVFSGTVQPARSR